MGVGEVNFTLQFLWHLINQMPTSGKKEGHNKPALRQGDDVPTKKQGLSL
jgi:hypothetical protein